MERKKLYLEAGEKGRVTADIRVAVKPESVKWNCGTSAVLMNEAEQNTMFDMRVVGVVPGMAYIEFSAESVNGEKLEEIVEVYVIAPTPENAPVAMHVRHARKYHSGSVAVDQTDEEKSIALIGTSDLSASARAAVFMSALKDLPEGLLNHLCVDEHSIRRTEEDIQGWLDDPENPKSWVDRWKERIAANTENGTEIKEISGVGNADLPPVEYVPGEFLIEKQKEAETAQESSNDQDQSEAVTQEIPVEEVATAIEEIESAAFEKSEESSATTETKNAVIENLSMASKGAQAAVDGSNSKEEEKPANGEAEAEKSSDEKSAPSETETPKKARKSTKK